MRTNGLGLGQGNCHLSARRNILTLSKTDAFQVGKERPWHHCCWRRSALGRPLSSLRRKHQAKLLSQTQKTLMEQKKCPPSLPTLTSDAGTSIRPDLLPGSPPYVSWDHGWSSLPAPRERISSLRLCSRLPFATFHPCCFAACGTVPAMFATEQTSFKTNSCC